MFTKDQIETIVTFELNSLLWSSTDSADEAEHEFFSDYYDSRDATPELRAKLTAELEALRNYDVDFTAEFETALAVYAKHFDMGFLSQFGHDLALTRNHHGVGFDDRGLDRNVSAILSNWAESLGEMNLFHGHDSIHPQSWAGKFHAEEVR